MDNVLEIKTEENALLLKNEFDENAIVARYGDDGMTYFTGKFNELGEGIFSENLNME